jgi:hypothetical protein
MRMRGSRLVWWWVGRFCEECFEECGWKGERGGISEVVYYYVKFIHRYRRTDDDTTLLPRLRLQLLEALETGIGDKTLIKRLLENQKTP